MSGLIADEVCRSFLVGSYGQFDRLAASVCLRLKKADPAITVRLVVPYYQPQLDSYEQAYRARFDEVIVPALESTPYRYRIVRANEYMINCADVVIAYVRSPTGGQGRLPTQNERNGALSASRVYTFNSRRTRTAGLFTLRRAIFP